MDLLNEGIERLDLEVSDGQLEKMDTFKSEIALFNPVYKLVGYEEELFYHCIGTIPEVFDGNPPFHGRGAMSFAMNVAEIMRVVKLLDKYNMD